MPIQESKIIIADDLTGANDTALQFFKSGSATKVIIDSEYDFKSDEATCVWSFSTESRNVSKEEALEKIIEIGKKLSANISTDEYYKKIDSTLRGNIGTEILAMLEILQKQAAIITPAYIEEERTTIGGYQLLNGIPIERTQVALDPKAPILDSYIPSILKKDINPQLHNLIDIIPFETVTKGAGPIGLKINELIKKEKRLIVVDAISNTDLTQIALAIKKLNINVLPVGSAGLACAINKIENDNTEIKEHVEHCPNFPRLIVSGSATKLTKNQIEKLKAEKNTFSIDLKLQDIIETNVENLSDIICEKLKENKDVIVHSSDITNEIKDENGENKLIDAGIAKNEMASLITEFLSNLVQEINEKENFILVLLGGETSYKCLSKINSKYLQIIDAIMPAIPLCIDINGKIITTKSGNFGNNNTLVEIIDYFNKLR